jgi:hypothetical protein
VLDAAGITDQIEALLVGGVRPRQLPVRTLLLGMLCCVTDDRPAHLTRVHQALVGLGAEDKVRLGVIADWHGQPHTLTYRQVEYTFSLVVRALAKDHPDGAPSAMLQLVSERLLEASVNSARSISSAEAPAQATSLAIDWSDLDSPAHPPPKDRASADTDASWGRRASSAPGQRHELFFGYYFSLATMVPDDGGRLVPELVRRMVVSSCHLDPVPVLVGSLERLVESGVGISDVLCDSGYAHRMPERFALRIRRLGAKLVMDLHPHDRGPQGTFNGAVLLNGNLYCPSTPEALVHLSPLSRDASDAAVADHDRLSAELTSYKLGRITTDDRDGYHRVSCPAAQGKLRCPLRQESLALSFAHPEVLDPPDEPPPCCVARTITVPPEVNAKTRQKHDYPSAAHRRSYARRTAVERSNSRVKDPATTNVVRGWCRTMGLVPLTLFLSCAFVARNLATMDAFVSRQAREQELSGTAPRTRKRRRRTIDDLLANDAAQRIGTG